MKIFVLIPAYNERGNLEKLIGELEKEFNRLKMSFKIFLVLQGNDGSRELIEKLAQKKKFIGFIHYPKPLGIGNAYKRGFMHLSKSADFVLTMDADLNHDPKDIKRLLAVITKEKTDVVIGSRFVPDGVFADKRAWKRLTSLLTNKLIQLMAKLSVKDISSGYRLMKRDVVEKIKSKLTSSGYPYYMEFILLAAKSGFKIREIPITYHPRIWGKSKIGNLRTVFDYMKFLGKLLINS